jgi:vWA-MoxR associated protein C-terminal domain
VSVDPSKLLAYVVGIERYDAGAKWNLQGPVRDALDFAAWLVARGLGPANIHAFLSPIKPLTEEDFERQGVGLKGMHVHEAKTPDLYAALNAMLRDKKPEYFCLYWGGHGCFGPNKQQYLLGADATNEDPQGINLTQFMEFLATDAVRGDAGGEVRHSVLIIDACASYMHARGVQHTVASSTFSLGKPLVGTQFALFATDTGERAKNLNAQNTGLFSRELREEMQHLDNLGALLELAPVGIRLRERFEALQKRGEASQTPTYYAVQPYFDREKVLGSPGLGSLEARFPTHSVTLEELEHLHAIAATLKPPLSRERLLAHFRSARRFDEQMPQAIGEYSLFCACTAVLARHFPGPLFTFLALCRSNIEDAAASASIAAWEVAAATRLKIDLAGWHGKAIELAAASAQRVVQLVIDPVFGGAGEEYQVRAAFAVDEESDPAKIVSLGRSETVGCDRLSGELKGLFAEVLGHLDSLEIARVEAVLPRELLAAGAHHWEAQWGRQASPIGLEFPIAIRSHERGYEKDYRGPRRTQIKKWELLRHGLKEEQIAWESCLTKVEREIFLRWRQTETLALGALRFSVNDEAVDADVVEWLICAGIPAGLWFHRPDAAVEGWQGVLRAGFFGRDIGTWPPRVLQFHQHDLQNNPFACHGLTLMWDNPKHPLPPVPDRIRAPLQAPS